MVCGQTPICTKGLSGQLSEIKAAESPSKVKEKCLSIEIHLTDFCLVPAPPLSIDLMLRSGGCVPSVHTGTPVLAIRGQHRGGSTLNPSRYLPSIIQSWHMVTSECSETPAVALW